MPVYICTQQFEYLHSCLSAHCSTLLDTARHCSTLLDTAPHTGVAQRRQCSAKHYARELKRLETFTQNTFRMATNSRPALVHPEESQAAKEMSATLQHISVWNLKAQMTAAKVPGAEHVDWKEDLIALAVQHEFSYVFRRELSLPPKQQPATALATSQPQVGGSVATQREIASGGSVATKRVIIIDDALGNFEEQVVDIVVDIVPPHAPALTCVADSLAKLYEAEWTQAFHANFKRGYEFPDTHTGQEIQVIINKMGHDSCCCFHKTDEYIRKVPNPKPANWTDGWDVTLRFECPHRKDAGGYIPQKGRVTTEDCNEAWRNAPRDSLHVTGTKCKASFSIKGMLQLGGKYKWRVSPKQRANFSMVHSGHPPPYAKYLQQGFLSSVPSAFSSAEKR